MKNENKAKIIREITGKYSFIILNYLFFQLIYHE